MDLEYGVEFSKRYRELVRLYTEYKKLIWHSVIILISILIVVFIKSSILTIEKNILENSGFTIDEDPYQVFALPKDVVTISPDLIRFPVKNAQINIELQKANLKQTSDAIAEFLKEKEWECVHLKHLGVPYDMIGFNTGLLMIEPIVVRIGEEYTHIPEENVRGELQWKKRPKLVEVSFMDRNLAKSSRVLLENAAFCFAHYYGIS